MAPHALLIVFGGGDARASKRYLNTGERVIAVEPRPEAANALQSALGARGAVVIAAAGDGTEKALLTRYDLPEYTSEHRLASLSALFPGMKGAGSLSAERVDAGDLLSEAVDEDIATVAIIIDVNGAERAVLKSLSRAAAFRRVGRLEIRCGAEALFEGAMTAGEAETFLVETGFNDVKSRGAGPVRMVGGERNLEGMSVVSQSEAREEAEALWAELQAGHDEAIRSIQADLDAAKAAKMDAEALIDSVNEELDEAWSQHARVERELDNARASLEQVTANAAYERAEHDEALKAYWADLDTVKIARDQAETRLETLSKDLKEANSARARAEETAGRLEQEAAAVRIELGSLRSNFESLRLQAASAEEERARLAGEVEEVREALHAARSDLSLALHSKAIAEDDLRDLRHRFSELAEIKERQDDLLHRLSHRLGEASQVLASAPESSVFRALAGENLPAKGDAPEVSRKPATKPRGPRKKKTAKSAK